MLHSALLIVKQKQTGVGMLRLHSSKPIAWYDSAVIGQIGWRRLEEVDAKISILPEKEE